MFVGHHALGFAAKKVAPRISLGWLIAAPIFLDLVWPIFVLLGIEHVRITPGITRFTPLDLHHYPYSHSLVAAIGWSLLVGGLCYWRTRDRAGARVVGLLVLSHWVLDWVTHRPDLPLWPGGPKVGLGLWDSVPGTLAVEVAMFVAGVWLYASSTRPVDRAGTWSLVAFVSFLAVTYAGAAFGPPPPNVTALAWTTMLTWLLPLWAASIDRHRTNRA